jgi:hypothetical protein
LADVWFCVYVRGLAIEALFFASCVVDQVPILPKVTNICNWHILHFLTSNQYSLVGKVFFSIILNQLFIRILEKQAKLHGLTNILKILVGLVFHKFAR